MKNSEQRINADGSVDHNPLNRDPLSGKPGAHPVGTGVGAAGGGAAGAAIGTAVAGPVGALVGAVVGVVGGGLAGKAAGEAVNPTADTLITDPLPDTSYWREQFMNEPYYQSGLTFEDYEPAYLTGIAGHRRHPGRTFDEVAAELENDYALNRGRSNLGWDRAQAAMRAAWHRVERILPGDADGDGR